MASSQEFFHAEHGQLPVRDVVINVRPESRERFFERLKVWAASDGLSIRVVQLDPKSQTFGVDIWSRDLLLSGENYDEADAFYFDLYVNGSQDAQLVEDKVRRLRDALSGMDGISARQ